MNLNNFQNASLEEKAKFVWPRNHCVAVRSQGDCQIMLYHTGQFFVEVWYNAAEEHLITIRGFNDCQLLDFYLDEITLPVLFEV
jgi:hypothetical protein